jgi:hypothetical protein
MNAIPNELRDLLANLVLLYNRPDPSWTLTPDLRPLLVRWIEQALIEPDFHRQYLNHLQTLLGKTLPTDSPVTEEEEQRLAEEEQQVVDSGLEKFPADRLLRLAIDPVALMCLRAAIFDPEELPDYWWQRAKVFANERRPLKTPTEILETLGLPQPPPPHKVPPRPGKIPVALGDSPSALTAEQPERWTIDVPLADLQWIAPSAPPAPADPEESFLRLLLTFWPQETPPRLEVQLGGIASLIGQVSCTARLIFAEATNKDRRLTFTGLSKSDLSGATLEGEYHKEGGYHFRFRTVLREK